MQQEASELTIVGPKARFPKVILTEPSQSGYLLLAAEVDHRLPFTFGLESGTKAKLLKRLKAFATSARWASGVIEGVVLKAILIPPGRGRFLKQRPQIPPARFDVAMIVEFETPGMARAFAATEHWQSLVRATRDHSRNLLSVTATNARRIGPVDHSRDGVFLLNYFYADEVSRNLAVWEYTAGWFEDQTGLDNSTLFLPDEPADLPYKIINHCRWNRMGDILPQLLFYRSFHSFVLANFDANHTAAMPVLYKLA